MNKNVLKLIDVENIPDKIETSQVEASQNFTLVYVSKTHSVGSEMILSVTFFSMEKRTPVFRMFFDSKSFITEILDIERRWSSSTLRTLVSYVYGSNAAVCANKRSENQICKFFQAKVNPYHAMDKFQQELRNAQLKASHKRETDMIDKKMKEVKDLPKKFELWLDEVVMNFSRYIYYKRKSKHLINGYCTSCSSEVEFSITKKTPFSNVRHNQSGKCPSCGKIVTFKAVGRTMRQHDNATAAIMQRTEAGFLIRYFNVHKNYREHYQEPTLSFYEFIRCFHEGENVINYEYAEYRNTGKYRWCHANGKYHVSAACLYTRNVRRILTKTDLKYSCMYELAKNVDKFNIYSYIKAYRDYPAYEYLIKLRLYRLVSQNTLCIGTNSANLKFNGKGIQEVVGINRVQLKQMQRLDGTVGHLSLIKGAEEIGIALKDEHIEKFLEWGIDSYRMNELLLHVTPQKIINYISRNEKYWQQYWDANNSFKSLQYDFSEYWKDYLQNCILLGYDMKSSFILFPRDLKARHDTIMALVETEKKELLDIAIHSLYEPLYSRFHFVWKGIFIRPPMSVDEIIVEGHKLHHCVGTGSYIENMAKGKCCILLVRNAKQPDNPFFTIEFRNNKVIQCRGINNCGMTKDIMKFIAAWQKEICDSTGK